MRSLEKIRRVADQTCSAHANLRDKWATRALALDLAILSASAWTLALAFSDAAIAARLTPLDINPTIWTGIMAVAIFIATLIQLKLDPKARSDGHPRACEAQAEVKKAAAEAARRGVDHDGLVAVEARLAQATAIGVHIPEREFVKLKRPSPKGRAEPISRRASLRLSRAPAMRLVVARQRRKGLGEPRCPRTSATVAWDRRNR